MKRRDVMPGMIAKLCYSVGLCLAIWVYAGVILIPESS